MNQTGSPNMKDKMRNSQKSMKGGNAAIDPDEEDARLDRLQKMRNK